MKQISKHKTPKPKNKSGAKTVYKRTSSKRNHPQYGTSKLEQDFARDFLDVLKLNYIWQFEAKDIGRFFDYYLVDHNLIIEIDGSYWHGDPRVVKEENLTYVQKRAKRVDAYKDKWALEHGIPIMRIWEKDIRERPNEVMAELKKRLYIEEEKNAIKNGKKKRHKNNLK